MLALRSLSKRYDTPAGTFFALREVSLDVMPGELALIVGQSGSGKSTLLNVIAGIERPTSGEVWVGDTLVPSLSESAMALWRGRNVGIVFQFFQLLPTLTALENVMLPMDFCATWPRRERRSRGMALLERLGVADQAMKVPSTLSGGQQQRVAIARALANNPAVILADEPTGNLDSRNASLIYELFAGLVGDGQTVVMVTHDPVAVRIATRVIQIADGQVELQRETVNA
ncbi:MAG: transporter ATP-binding protein [Gemmatimonadetes bacterium]|nr:transporter ATP-binding protein [Gemmatimonadota bacterium]